MQPDFIIRLQLYTRFANPVNAIQADCLILKELYTFAVCHANDEPSNSDKFSMLM